MKLLRYLRLEVFNLLMRPFGAHARQRRMQDLAEIMALRDGMTVFDLGGQPAIWDSVPHRLQITILNLPGIAQRSHPSHHDIRYVEGDACAVVGFSAQQFDLVFSNSVIEHVGDAAKRASFAAEARRLGKCYWVQTPSKWFPIEAHCGMPFWWFYPNAARSWFIRKWRAKLPAWTEMVEGTTVLERTELSSLFPDGRIITERVLGLPKSYVVYRSAPGT